MILATFAARPAPRGPGNLALKKGRGCPVLRSFWPVPIKFTVAAVPLRLGGFGKKREPGDRSRGPDRREVPPAGAAPRSLRPSILSQRKYDARARVQRAARVSR